MTEDDEDNILDFEEFAAKTEREADYLAAVEKQIDYIDELKYQLYHSCETGDEFDDLKQSIAKARQDLKDML